MAEVTSVNQASLNALPTELLFYLFEFLPPKALIKCREVCLLWRHVIDSMNDENLWQKFCERDYFRIYKQAKLKASRRTSWFEIYRSLSLWPQLTRAKEDIDEFCHSKAYNEELKSAVVIQGGVIQVHKRTRVIHYDLSTLEFSKRRGPVGEYIKFVEYEDIVLAVGLNSQLNVIDKPHHNWESDLVINTLFDNEIRFDNVNIFLVQDRVLYFATYRNDVFCFNLDNDVTATHIAHYSKEEIIAALGFSDGCLNIFTMVGKMYTYRNSILSEKFDLDSVSNLMDCIYRHNMLEILDWRMYYLFLSNMKHERAYGILQFICKMRTYGDLFLIGTVNGRFLIYYKPFINGELNLFGSVPLKSYDFSSRFDIPILPVYPIISIEVIETQEGHQILLCMPRKILVITYKHEFEIVRSKAVIPYIPLPMLLENT